MDALTCADAQRTWLETLDFALHWRLGPGRPYMAMIGYFDESGTHGRESPLVTVAGFLATVEQWAAYERDLSTLMVEYGVKVFHAKDFRGRNFKNWPRLKRARFNSRFLKLADDHLSCGMSMILPSATYHGIYRSAQFPPTARPDTQIGMCTRFGECLLDIQSILPSPMRRWSALQTRHTTSVKFRCRAR
jgi:hypothetical protein